MTRLPAPPGLCRVCGAPARMALGVSCGVAGADASGRPRAFGVIHETVYYDWRAAPSLDAVRLFCKAHGLTALAGLADLYVADDGPAVLDPAAGPADSRETFLAHVLPGERS